MSSQGPRIALVIGNGRYRYVPPLTNPRNDARLIARTLHDLGFELVDGGAQLDLDKDSLERVLQDFSKKLPGASVALFFYAGHGLQMAGDNFLVPTSANPETPSDVNLQMVDAQVILEMMQDAGARLNIVILDACRNNPFGGRRLQRALTHGLAEMQAPEGTLIAYATQPGAVASDGAGADSPYTAALAQVMRRRDVEVRQVFNDVGLIVNKETGGSQTPWMANSPISGYFYFAGQPAAAPSPTSAQAAAPPSPTSVQAAAAPSPTSAKSAAAPSPTSVQAAATYIPFTAEAELKFWDSIKDSTDQRDFRAYLRQFPRGQFKFLAQARLVELPSPPPAAGITPAILPADTQPSASPFWGYGAASASRTANESAAPSTEGTPARMQALQAIPASKAQKPNSTPIQVASASVPKFSNAISEAMNGSYIVAGEPLEKADAELLAKRFKRFGYHPSLVTSTAGPNSYSLKFGPYSSTDIGHARGDLLNHWHDLTFHLIVNSSAGSWMDSNAADTAAETVQRLGANPVLVSRELNDQVRYEIEIGPFVTEQEAMSAGEMLGDKYADSLNCPWGNCNWQYTWNGAPPRLLCPDATRACKPDE
jgi:hypothetical protein